jgi:hypothetical protein
MSNLQNKSYLAATNACHLPFKHQIFQGPPDSDTTFKYEYSTALKKEILLLYCYPTLSAMSYQWICPASWVNFKTIFLFSTQNEILYDK